MYLLHSIYVPMYMHDTIILQTPPHFWSTYIEWVIVLLVAYYNPVADVWQL